MIRKESWRKHGRPGRDPAAALAACQAVAARVATGASVSGSQVNTRGAAEAGTVRGVAQEAGEVRGEK